MAGLGGILKWEKKKGRSEERRGETKKDKEQEYEKGSAHPSTSLKGSSLTLNIAYTGLEFQRVKTRKRRGRQRKERGMNL